MGNVTINARTISADLTGVKPVAKVKTWSADAGYGGAYQLATLTITPNVGGISRDVDVAVEGIQPVSVTLNRKALETLLRDALAQLEAHPAVPFQGPRNGHGQNWPPLPGE